TYTCYEKLRSSCNARQGIVYLIMPCKVARGKLGAFSMATRWRWVLCVAVATAALAGAPALAQSTATYTYDSEGRLTVTTYASGASATYSYDNADNRSHLVTSPGTHPPV